MEKVRQEAIETRANRIGAVLCLFDEDGGNNHVRIHRPERNVDLRGEMPSPSLWLSHGIFIADEKCGMHVRE